MVGKNHRKIPFLTFSAPRALLLTSDIDHTASYSLGEEPYRGQAAYCRPETGVDLSVEQQGFIHQRYPSGGRVPILYTSS